MLALGGPLPVRAAATAPRLGLIAATDHLVLRRPPQQPAYLQGGVYLASLGSAFDLRVGRTDYDHPVTVRQILHGPGADTSRSLPSDILDGWFGLKDFLKVTISGPPKSRELTTTFCPSSYDQQRVNDEGPANPTFPLGCGANPFTLRTVWGIDQGWAVNPLSYVTPVIDGPDGDYHVTFAIANRYVDLFDISSQNASVAIDVTVKTDPNSCCGGVQAPRAEQGSRSGDVPTVTNPDPSTLPDLVALPSWLIFPGSFSDTGNRDLLSFATTEWIGGNGPMVVEGFRREGTNVMDAYQYFYKDGKPVARARAGTLHYDSRKGHEHWHFEQFAHYRLLDSTKAVAVVSRKQSFCLAPTDAIDLGLPGATWNVITGFVGACGTATSLWVRETLPLGWGDTYLQFVPGQSFDITNVPNGTYFIEVTVNPLHLLHETKTGNNVTLRKIILGGKRGARTVDVPPWHGIDTEGCYYFCGGSSG